MGLLRREGANAGTFLRAQQTVGRDADNDIIIPRPSISGRHATIAWTASGWVLRDTSTYGTLVNGGVVKGSGRLLKRGDALTFVEADEVWKLVDDAPPGLLLAAVDDPATVIHVAETDGLLAVPSEAKPEATIIRVADGWWVEAESGRRERILDGMTVDLLGTAYRASVPRVIIPTAEPENPASPFSLDFAHFEINVLRGEDEAELVIQSGSTSKVIRPSRPLYLVAFLAEERARPSVDDGGWMSTDLACNQLGVDRTFLNVDVHRVREAVKATGLAGAANIIERRASQIRIGVPPDRFTVVRSSGRQR